MYLIIPPITFFLQCSILSFQEFKILCQCNIHCRFGCIFSWNQYQIFFTVWSDAMIPLYNLYYHQCYKCTTLAFRWENCQKDETGKFTHSCSMYQNGRYWLYLDILHSFTTHMNKYVWNNEMMSSEVWLVYLYVFIKYSYGKTPKMTKYVRNMIQDVNLPVERCESRKWYFQNNLTISTRRKLPCKTPPTVITLDCITERLGAHRSM